MDSHPASTARVAASSGGVWPQELQGSTCPHLRGMRGPAQSEATEAMEEAAKRWPLRADLDFLTSQYAAALRLSARLARQQGRFGVVAAEWFLLGPCGALCAQIWPLGGQNRARGTFASLRSDGEISEIPEIPRFFIEFLQEPLGHVTADVKVSRHSNV